MRKSNAKFSKQLIYSSIIIFTLSLIFAHAFSSSEYDWQKNTISQLAAQNYNLSWIMQIGFFSFGVLFLIGIVFRIKQSSKVQITDILLFFYGLAILLSGMFSAKPFIEGIPYSFVESGLHYAFALSAGMFLNLSVFACLLFSHSIKLRLFHFTFLMTIFISSLFVVLIKEEHLDISLGLMQRITYITGLVWLFMFFLKKARIETNSKLRQQL
ncbi:DUF998 domain-containing protein [Patescibacteria group bacterium]|nr:DUF998 domain-containing protein [Patescibacteria group bacterium]